MENDSTKPLLPRIKDWLQIILLVFGTAWGIYTFVYKEIIVPSRRPAALRLTATLEEVGRKMNMVLVRARIVVSNQSDTKIYAPALWYTATAFRLNAEEMSDSAYATVVEGTLDQQYGRTTRYSQEDSTDVVATWRVPRMEWWYEPKDETTNEELFYVPADQYDAVTLKVEVWVTKSLGELLPTQWKISSYGALVPQLLLRGEGYSRDSTLVEPFDPSRERHKKWYMRNGVAHNECIATLSLLRKEDLSSATRKK